MAAKSLLLMLLTCCTFAFALDPPTKLWEKWYYTDYEFVYFRDIELTPSGNLFVTGLIWNYIPPPIPVNLVAILLNQDGEIIWEVPFEFAGANCYDGEVLPDGSFIVTGSGSVDSSSTTTGLYIHKIAQDGTTEWAQIYDFETTKEEGYGVTCLPDGGFAVCGRVNGTGSGLLGQAWILRTDANGDTLWTDVWGEHTINFAKSIVYDPNNNWIVACAYGRSDTLINRGPHLLYYSLDGTFLHGTTYPELYPEWVRGMCTATDGGFTFLSRFGAGTSDGTLTHTDSSGEIIWSESIPAQPTDDNDNLGLGFAQYDGGYLCCGWTGYWSPPDNGFPFAELEAQADTGSTKDGWLVRFDAGGNILWSIGNEMGHDNHFYTAVQLPEGGYFAAGTYTGSGYLVRYSAETGIEGSEPSQATTLSIAPNPFSSSLSINYSLPEPAQLALSVYDLSGRVVEDLGSTSVSIGEHSCVWSPSADIPDGCYLIVLDACGERVVRRAVLLR